MDPVTHRRMRTAHLNHSETCTCGRQVFGNGRLSHLRACRHHLAKVGWPLGDAWHQAIFAEYRGRGAADIVRGVEQRLGQFYLDRRDSGQRMFVPAAEERDMIWKYAAEAARELA